MKTFKGYSSPEVSHYDCSVLHSTESYDQTFEMRLNIGGTVINTEECFVDIVLPSGTITYGGTPDYEVVSISGTVSRIN